MFLLLGQLNVKKVFLGQDISPNSVPDCKSMLRSFAFVDVSLLNLHNMLNKLVVFAFFIC